MDDVERALSPLTMHDVEAALWLCRNHKRKSAFLNVGSARSDQLLGEILSGKSTARPRTNDEIERLGSEQKICLLQLMFLEQFPDADFEEAYIKAKNISPSGIAGYMSEKTTLYTYLTRGLSRIERRT